MTTTDWKENGFFFTRHTPFLVSKEQAHAIGELLKGAYKGKNTKAFVIDNREAKVVWTQEVNKIWM